MNDKQQYIFHASDSVDYLVVEFLPNKWSILALYEPHRILATVVWDDVYGINNCTNHLMMSEEIFQEVWQKLEMRLKREETVSREDKKSFSLMEHLVLDALKLGTPLTAQEILIILVHQALASLQHKGLIVRDGFSQYPDEDIYFLKEK
jgi:hypothetical protein